MGIYVGYIVLILLEYTIMSKIKFRNEKRLNNKDVEVKNREVFLLIACIQLIILAGLRGYTVGADLNNYLGAIEYYGKLPMQSVLFAKLVYPFDYEIGYFIFVKLCAFLRMNNTVFLLMVAVITYVPIFKLIKKKSTMPFLSIFIYFSFGTFSYSLGLFRQMIAISIITCGIKYIEQKKLCKYIFVIILAMMFHTTAIIMLPFYWIQKIDFKKLFIWIIWFEVVGFLFGKQIINLAVYLLPKYSGYIDSTYGESGGGVFNLAFLNVIMLIGLIYNMYTPQKAYQNRFFLNALAIAICFQVVGYHMEIFGRIVSYYSIYLIILIPQMITSLFKGRSKYIGISVVMLFLCLRFCMTFIGNEYICPYYFFWQD